MKLAELLGDQLVELISSGFSNAIEDGRAAALAENILDSAGEARPMIEPFMEIFAKIPQGGSLIHVDELAVHAARPADAVKFLLEHYEPGKQVTIAPAD